MLEQFLLNGLLHVGKDESWSGDVSVPTDIIVPLFKSGHNITSGNYFTSLDLYFISVKILNWDQLRFAILKKQ